jgi:putative transcriptional regulator
VDRSDLDEAILRPVQPSELARRDDALANAKGGGAHAKDLADAKAVVAAVGLASYDAPPPPALRDRLLASMNRPGRHGRYADRLARMFDLPIDKAEKLAAKLDDPDAYTPFFVPGVEVMNVEAGPKYANAIALIAKIPPGVQFPHHTHRGEETMFVLAGGFKEDKGGSEVWRGDELVSADGSDHSFVALPGEPCIAASLVIGHADF